jgi:hypothetical protein
MNRFALIVFVAAPCVSSCTQRAGLGAFSISSDAHDVSEIAPLIGWGLEPGRGKSGLVASLDVALAHDPAGIDTSTFYFARGAYVHALAGGKAYLLGGGALVYESSDATGTSMLGAVDLGAGLGLGTRLDLRAVYSIFVGTENAEGALSATLGYAF